MSNALKITLYVVLAILASISGYYALTSFGQMMARAGTRNSDLERIEPDHRPALETAVAPLTATATNAATNQTEVASTNLPAAATNVASDVVSNTNSTAVAQAQAATNAPVDAPQIPATPPVALRPAAKQGGHLGLWAAVFVISLLGLGLLAANDISHYFGNRALKVLYNDEGEGQQNPEYEKAEELWANGQHLDAINLMREYLAKNPREQHVAIRIAEIYEKDLKNNLAAALEYEEVLKHKLPAERWGWAAVHLCNLYFRLSQEQKGYALLRKIVNDYPNTAAAEKARKRLEQVGEGGEVEAQPAEPAFPAQAPESRAPASNLPPGFRPKK